MNTGIVRSATQELSHVLSPSNIPTSQESGNIPFPHTPEFSSIIERTLHLRLRVGDWGLGVWLETGVGSARLGAQQSVNRETN